jgi:hypothetical protein
LPLERGHAKNVRVSADNWQWLFDQSEAGWKAQWRLPGDQQNLKGAKDQTEHNHGTDCYKHASMLPIVDFEAFYDSEDDAPNSHTQAEKHCNQNQIGRQHLLLLRFDSD